MQRHNLVKLIEYVQTGLALLCRWSSYKGGLFSRFNCILLFWSKVKGPANTLLQEDCLNEVYVAKQCHYPALTLISLESFLWDIVKQYKTRSDAAKRGV